MKLTYAVVFEKAPNNWGAYAPDVPGCVSVGDTWEEMLEMIQEALTFHIESMLEDGDPVPEATMSIEEAIAYHLELASEDIREILPDLDDFPPTVATRFEPVEIEVYVPQAEPKIPEPAQAS